MKDEQTLQHYATNEQEFVRECQTLKRDVLQTGRPKVTNFLTLRQQEILREVVGKDLKLLFYGGINNSERQLAILSEHDVQNYENNVVVLLIAYNNKFGVLRHQDVLGAILGLGLERKVVGDIIVEDASIFVAVRSTIAKYLIEQLQQVGKQAVKIQMYAGQVTRTEEKFQEKTIYVNSLRLDSLISHILPCNREEAKAVISKELVQINGVASTNKTATYTVGDIISVRRFGRIYIDDIVKTRRDRFKIEVRIT